MRVPIFSNVINLAAFDDVYASPHAAGKVSTNEAVVGCVVPVSGNMTAFRVTTNNVNAGSLVVTVNKNTVATTTTVTFPGTVGGTQVWGGTVAVVAGDIITVHVANRNGASAISWELIITPTTGGDSLCFLGPQVVDNSGTTPYYPFTPSTSGNGTEGDCSAPCPVAGTFSKLYIALSAAPGGGKSYIFTLMKNGVATALTCTITGAVATTGSDTSNSVAVVAGDLLSIKGDATGSPTSVYYGGGVKFVPTSGSRTIYLTSKTTLGTSTNYGPLAGLNETAGNSAWRATESATTNPAATRTGDFYLFEMYVKLATAAGSGKTRTFTVRKNGTTALGQTVALANVTTGNFTTPATALANEDWLDIQHTATAASTESSVGIGLAFNDGAGVMDYAKTVTTDFHFTHAVGLPGSEETTIDSTYSKLALGGRQMTRIGSRIYVVAVDSSKTYVVYLDDEAETWHSEQVVNWPAVAAAITQGAGSQPVLALARSGFPRILTYLRAGAGSWTAGATTVSAGTNDLESFQILYDNTNYHLVYAGYNTSTGAKTVYHRKTTSIASWPAATAVDVGDIPRTGANRDRALSAVLDKDGDIHLVYTQSVSNRFSLRYRKYAASAWSAATEIEDLGSSLTESNRCVHLSITTTGAKIPWIFGVKWNGSLVKQIYAWSKPVSTWTAEGVLATQNADQEYPSSGVQNLDIPSVVFSGNFVDGRIQYLEKRNGAWARECVSADYTNNKPDQVYDPFRKNAQTLEGAFITVSGSIDVIVTTVLVWGDGAYASGGAGFTQNIFIKGRDKVNNTLSFTQTIGLSHGYTNTFTHGAAFTSIVVLTRTLPRSVSKGVLLTQAIGLTAILGGVTTYYKHVAHSLVFDSVFTRGVREQHQTVTHSLVFHQVGPGLTRYKSVASQIEFVDDSAASSIKHDTATTNVGLESVVFLNKSLNLTVTHGLAFGSAPVRVRAWVWNSTHFDPGWAAEYEASVSDFLIMGPDEAPTIEITLPKPDMDDENVLFRREQSVRRNRTGSAKSFVTPVYQEFKYQWSGFLRKRAEEFRHAIGPLLGKNVRIRDHNGVWHSVKITDTRITSTQKSPEYVVVGLTFEKNEAVY